MTVIEPHSVSAVAHRLDAELRPNPCFIAVGVAQERGGEPRLYVYYEPPALMLAKRLVQLHKEGCEGFPVTIVETSKPVAAGENP